MISGTFDEPTVGRIYTDGDPAKLYGSGSMSGGGMNVIYFTAESDPIAIGPCFKVRSPWMSGQYSRISAFPVTGYAPSRAATLTIADEFGATWTATMPVVGSYSLSLSASLSLFVARFWFSIDDLGGPGRRTQIALHTTDALY